MLRRKATIRAPAEDPSKLFDTAQSYANGRSSRFGFVFLSRSLKG
jgi:hypothetical protein